ncbi:MAG: Lrp/AsnC family transcriptional regulator [Lachnospiraceae bacterium]|nr:Lrp/AsnC family transcriptional regulator [Lachnospiraceae bacterium]
MNIEGLDTLDNKILDVLKDNARATFSEIGEKVGLSRVAVKNRMEVLEKNGIIKGYTTVIDKTKVPLGVQFILDVEAIPELYQDVVEVLATDRFLRQVYSTTGDCRLHAIGFAPNMNTLESHANHLFLRTKGIRKLSWHLLLKIIKDEDGGVEYVRYQKSEHLEGEQS